MSTPIVKSLQTDIPSHPDSEKSNSVFHPIMKWLANFLKPITASVMIHPIKDAWVCIDSFIYKLSRGSWAVVGCDVYIR